MVLQLIFPATPSNAIGNLPAGRLAPLRIYVELNSRFTSTPCNFIAQRYARAFYTIPCHYCDMHAT